MTFKPFPKRRLVASWRRSWNRRPVIPARVAARRNESLTASAVRSPKDAARDRGRKRAQDGQGPAGERYASTLAVLGDGQQRCAPIQVDVDPLYGQQLAAPHTRFEREYPEMHALGVASGPAVSEQLLFLIAL
jgi:hypothetical protein